MSLAISQYRGSAYVVRDLTGEIVVAVAIEAVSATEVAVAAEADNYIHGKNASGIRERGQWLAVRQLNSLIQTFIVLVFFEK